MIKSFTFQNEKLNKTQFLVELGVSQYDTEKHSVSFYDVTDGNNQKISTYFLGTLIEDMDYYDLTLHGGIPEWTLENECILSINKLWGHLN